MNRLDVIDLSHHNTVSDFAAIKSAGVLGVIHKATEGTAYRDSTYVFRKASCKGAGLLFASYHFFRSSDPIAQMKFFVDTVLPEPEGHRLVIDYEDPKCKLADLVRAISWLRENVPGAGVTIYGGNVLKDHVAEHTFDYDVLRSTDLWVAHYTSSASPAWPTGIWPKWRLWQYTDGNVGGQPRLTAGVSGSIDCNMFNGQRDEIKDWFVPLAKAPKADPAPKPSAVSININVEGADTVHVNVNGKQIT